MIYCSTQSIKNGHGFILPTDIWRGIDRESHRIEVYGLCVSGCSQGPREIAATNSDGYSVDGPIYELRWGVGADKRMEETKILTLPVSGRLTPYTVVVGV